MTDDTAREARKGLGAKVAGKAKEVAGAMVGNDSLTAEGQLQQAEAEARRDASTKSALAQAKAAEGAEKLAREAQVTEQQRAAAAAASEARMQQVVLEGRDAIVQAQAEAEADKVAEQARADARAETQADRVDRAARQAAADAARVQRLGEARHDQLNAEAHAAEVAAAAAREEAARLDPNNP